MSATLPAGDERELRGIEQRIAQSLLDADAAYIEGDTREAGRLVEQAVYLHGARGRLLRAIEAAALAQLGVPRGLVIRVPGEQ